MKTPQVIFVMGVSGSGKSTVGSALARKLGIPFIDGDDFHPSQNITKMQDGQPLDDMDRQPWLDRLHQIALELLAGEGGVIACSALKESYRHVLMHGIPHKVKWIFLEGEYDVIRSRLLSRSGHYMPADLLASQIETLELPAYAFRISIQHAPEDIVNTIMSNMQSAEIGVIGLGVMGRGLALNFASKGYALALYNRHVPGIEEGVAQHFVATQRLQHVQAFDALPGFVAALQQPRKILLMIDAGRPVDDVLAQLSPLLSPGDVITDCGNSHYADTQRRCDMLAAQGLHYLGTGVSGGEKGAREGPAIMPGGSREGYVLLKSALERIAAKDRDQVPCCQYIGDGGAGHFVKMVHNGIEYAEMQLIAEIYGLLRHGYGHDPDAIAELFDTWNAGPQQSYLLDITTGILRHREGEGLLLDKISDVARSKGTSSWSLEAAHVLSTPSPIIAAAVHARFLSAQPDARKDADTRYGAHTPGVHAACPVDMVHDALYLSRLVNHHLGFELLRKAADVYAWQIDLREIARIWTNGCIIRSSLMLRLRHVLPHATLHEQTIVAQVQKMWSALQDILVSGMQHRVAMPCHSAAMNFLDGNTTQYPMANLIQAQRDVFGAHGYERIDDASGGVHHTQWDE